MQRAARERARTLRLLGRWKDLQRASPAADARPPANVFRKQRRIGGCHCTRCWLCHYDKLADVPTRQLRIAQVRMHEGLADYFAGAPHA